MGTFTTTTTPTTHLGLLLAALIVILLIMTDSTHSARTRLKNRIKIKYNLECHLPQCETNDPNTSAVNLFQVMSSNPETPFKTNFIWSNIGGPPMVIATSSRQESNLLIDWESLIGNNHKQTTNLQSETLTTSTPASNPPAPSSNTPTPIVTSKPVSQPTEGFHFNVTQDAAIGLLIEKIVLFDDTDRSGLFQKDKAHVEIDWNQVIWDLASKTIYEKDDFLKSLLRMKSNHKVMGGNLLIKLAIPRNYKAERQQEVPHLKLNNQSMSIVVVVDGMQPPASFKNPRLAITMVVIVQSPSNQVTLSTNSEPLISDEYTPGVFHIKKLQFKTKPNESQARKVDDNSNNPYVYPEGQTPEAKAALEGASPAVPAYTADANNVGFLYWKEVAYTDRRKIISRTVDVYDNEISMSMDTLPNISQPFYQYFKYEPSVGPKPEYKLYRFEMIFGKGESTYSATNFTDFSFVFGLGGAPRERYFSFLVKAVIFVCFCLPLLVMLAGLGYLMLRRFRRNGDTELLLAAES